MARVAEGTCIRKKKKILCVPISYVYVTVNVGNKLLSTMTIDIVNIYILTVTN